MVRQAVLGTPYPVFAACDIRLSSDSTVGSALRSAYRAGFRGMTAFPAMHGK